MLKNILLSKKFIDGEGVHTISVDNSLDGKSFTNKLEKIIKSIPTINIEDGSGTVYLSNINFINAYYD